MTRTYKMEPLLCLLTENINFKRFLCHKLIHVFLNIFYWIQMLRSSRKSFYLGGLGSGLVKA